MKFKNLFYISVTYLLITGFMFGTNSLEKGIEYQEKGNYPEAIKYLKKATENKKLEIKAVAYTELGDIYLEVDEYYEPRIAREYYIKAASTNVKPWRHFAIRKLAEMSYVGEGTEKDVNEAIRLYKIIAEEGTLKDKAYAYWRIGVTYEGLSKNSSENERKEALNYFIKCLEVYSLDKSCKDSIDSLNKYPDIYIHYDKNEYENNIDASPGDYKRANELFNSGKSEEAKKIIRWHAKNGNSDAQLDLFRLIINRINENANNTIAYGWLYLSAKNGNRIAQYDYGFAISSGKIQGSLNESLKWLNLSAEQDYADAYNELGRIWYEPIDIDNQIKPDYKKSFDYIFKGAKLGSIVATTNLGWMYLNGLGTEKNIDLAKAALEKSASMGDSRARLILIENFGESYKKTADVKREVNNNSDNNLWVLGS